MSTDSCFLFSILNIITLITIWARKLHMHVPYAQLQGVHPVPSDFNDRYLAALMS